MSRGASPFAIPAVDTAHLSALEMPRLSVRLDRGLIQRLIDGETFRLNADAAAIEAFEEKHRNRFSDTVKQVRGDPDLRAVWEPARLQHAALLLLHPAAGAAGREAGKGTVLNWIAANPFLRGPHYVSALVNMVYPNESNSSIYRPTSISWKLHEAKKFWRYLNYLFAAIT